jgi:hypothetical protein
MIKKFKEYFAKAALGSTKTAAYRKAQEAMLDDIAEAVNELEKKLEFFIQRTEQMP